MKQYYLNPNRKKIRGWKRRIKHINAWGEYIKQPYLKSFNKAGDYTYERNIIDPFYRLLRRQPPLWFYKLIINKFVNAYFEWEKAFNELSIPYDLQIWLYDPQFIQSEIICYAVENKGDRARYAWSADEQKPFPYDKFSIDDALLKRFEWLLFDDELVTFENELKDEDFTSEDLLAGGYVKKETDENVCYYAKRIGDIWVGRLK